MSQQFETIKRLACIYSSMYPSLLLNLPSYGPQLLLAQAISSTQADFVLQITMDAAPNIRHASQNGLESLLQLVLTAFHYRKFLAIVEHTITGLDEVTRLLDRVHAEIRVRCTEERTAVADLAVVVVCWWEGWRCVSASASIIHPSSNVSGIVGHSRLGH
jgi:hypothetical protein